MPGHQPAVTDMSGRLFACFPVGILVIIVNEEEQILLLAHPERKDGWETVKGALEAGETILL